MSYADILYDKSDGVATLTLNRPKVLNAFRTQTVLEMTDAVEDASADRSVGVMVITGAGERAFFGGLLGESVIMPVNRGAEGSSFIRRGGLIPAPIQSMNN